MAAANTDYFMKVGKNTATTLSNPGYTAGNTSINVASTTNWPTDTGVMFAIDETETNPDGKQVRKTGSYNVFRGTVDSATQITNVTYVGGDPNRNYSAGATTRVYILVSSDRDNRLIDGLLVSHNQNGTLKNGVVTTNTLAESLYDPWQDWTPVITALSPMVWTTTDIYNARYTVFGKTCTFSLRARGDTSGSASHTIFVTPPVTPRQNASVQTTFAAQVVQSGGFVAGISWINHYSDNIISIRPYDSSNFSLGNQAAQIYISGSYEIA